MLKFLAARYMGNNEKFEHSEVYRLEFKIKDDGRMWVRSLLGDMHMYKDVYDFKREWDMNFVPERYRQRNPEI